jgi:hypothetical protein
MIGQRRAEARGSQRGAYEVREGWYQPSSQAKRNRSGRMWFHLRRCAECGHIGSASDRSLVALLGASPGAPTAAFIAIGVLEECFPNELTANGWLPKLKQIIPSYGVSLIDDADFMRRVRADTATVLKVENI